MNKAIKIKKGYEIILALLFFAAMNFEAKFFYFLFLSFFIVIISRKCVVDSIMAVYFFLSLLMAIFNVNEGIMSTLRCFAPLCAYLIGFNLISYNIEVGRIDQKRLTEKRSFQIIVTLALGSFLHYLLNYLYNLGTSIGRNTNDIWTGVSMAATGQNALTCLVLGLSCAELFIPQQKWYRWAAVLNISIVLAYNLVLSCRTPIITLFILILACIFYPRENINYGTQLLKYLKWTALLIVVGFTIYILNVLGAREYVQNSPLGVRAGGSFSFLTGDKSRTIAKSLYISQLTDYPFGGCHMRAQHGYAHDLLLDAYDEYGFLVSILLVIVLVAGIKQLYFFLRKTNYAESIKLPFLLMCIATLLEFSIEPILTGMSWLLACFCLIHGCMTSMNREYLQDCKEGAFK